MNQEKCCWLASSASEEVVVENNNLAIIRTGAAACAEIPACSKAVVDIGLGALVGVGVATSAIENLSGTQKTDVMLAAMSGDPNLIDNLSPGERAAYEEWKGNQGLVTVFPVGEKDPTGGKLLNPAQDENKGTSLISPDQSGDQGASNTGNTDGASDKGGNTTVTPIPEQNKDDLAYLALKGKEAQEAAGRLGFDRRIPAQKAPFNSHGQPVFFDGKTYITPDVDSHNVTNGWKIFDRKGKRMGTYDSDLNKIKD
ncbi:toxin C-terminal domain-containing protein [Erwinia sp. MMLR14_017]|uniref:toxin C-terminal domain-containing protein n=1 Tax=Erwinia sp. MMLR14_017 TaxID=3093842 RepID=UPI00298FB415|nr:toxin C-terminal domain-containing protein [Erwinia sp. MMLR14_017]MDW8848444.1 toxin C-terminal domain-containing protein [Erwinia sp. MMLR14_017]